MLPGSDDRKVRVLQDLSSVTLLKQLLPDIENEFSSQIVLTAPEI